MIPWPVALGVGLFGIWQLYLFIQVIDSMGGAAPSRPDGPSWQYSHRKRYVAGINTAGTIVEHLRCDPKTETEQMMDAGGNYRDVKPTAQSQLTTNEELQDQDRGVVCNKCGQWTRVSNDQKSSIRCSCGNQIGFSKEKQNE